MSAQPDERLTYIDHAGNVYRHGYPQDAGGWTLDPDTKIQDVRAERTRKEPQPITCRICYTVYTGLRHCPGCGSAPTKESEKVNMAEGRLRKVKRKKVQKDDKQTYWNKVLYQCAHTGRSTGAAANMYRNKFGVWPRGLDRMPRGKAEWNMKASIFLNINRGENHEFVKQG